MNGGDVLVDALLELGVDTGFTVPGESFLHVLEALRRARNSFRLVSTRHEGGAAFAAEAYGRLTSRPAAVFVSRGPGATNASIGIHTARQSSSPLVLFIGHVRTRSKGREAFQEIDHHVMFSPVAKAVMEPESVDDIRPVVARAVRASVCGRPGPVVVVLPRDITEAQVGERVTTPISAPGQSAPTEDSIESAARLIANAHFPVIIAGEMVLHGHAEEALVEFADALAAPVLCAYRQMDVFPNVHPAYAGHMDINRAAFQRAAFARSDLIIAIGTRLDGITTEDYSLIRPDQRLVHLYPDDEVLERCGADAPLADDIAFALKALSRRIDDVPDDRRTWRDALHVSYMHHSSVDSARACGAVQLSDVVQTIAETLGDEVVLLTDGGSFARWVHRFYRFTRPRRFAGPVSGAMGYAVPGAIGAAIARADLPVIAFVGDGGFMMTGQELTTTARERMNIIVIVCDNQAHGSILYSQWQQFDRDSDYATRLASPDFAAVARAYGVAAWRVDRSADFAAALDAALAEDGPALLHLVTDQRDIVPADSEDDVV